MPRFTFDVKLWATVYVQAKSEKETRAKMREYLSDFSINHDHDGLSIEGMSAENTNEDELVEIDGEAV